jgi:hypothetical protein
LPPPGLDRLLDQSTQEAAKRDKGKAPKDKPAPAKNKPASKDKPAKAPQLMPDVSSYPPGERPCFHKGTGGAGPFKPKRQDGKPIPGLMVKCIYDCGGKEVEQMRPGDSEQVCLHNPPTW